MTQASPLLSAAFKLLRQDIYEHLDSVEYVAQDPDIWFKNPDDVLDVIPELIYALRAIMRIHSETPTGACGGCEHAWPCPVIGTIHEVVKEPKHQFVKIVELVRQAE